MNFLLREKEMGANSMDINLNMYQTLAAAVAVFFSGRFSENKNQIPPEILHSGAGHRRYDFFHHQLHSVH